MFAENLKTAPRGRFYLFFFLLKGLDDSFVGETFNSVLSSYFKKTLIVYSVAFFLSVFSF